MPTIAKHKDRTDKTKQAYDFFIGRGYTPEQASGIVGNLLKESNLSTSAEGDVGYSGGSSFGIAQWRGERLKNLQTRYGNKWKDFNSQLEFIDWELNNTEKKAGQALRNSKDVFEAGAVISDLYERPKVKFNQDKNRQSHVLNTYKKLANSEYQGEPITTDVNNLEFTQEMPNFASVPDIEIAEEKTDKDVEEVKQQTAEYNFLQEIQNAPQREALTQQKEQQPQQRQQVQTPNYLQQYEQISQFVDSPLIAQQGGIYDVTKIAPRKGERTNEDGTVSTHLMSYTEADGKFYAYPTLFQKEDGSWYELNDENNWEAFEEAKKRKEIFEFASQQEAENFSKGSWKNKQQGGTWQKQQEKVKAEKLAKLRELLKEKDVVKKLEQEAQQRRQQLPTERGTTQVDATKTAITNNPDRTSTTARNKTDKEIAEERQARIDAQTQANAQPFDWGNFRQSLADRSQATGDALRISNEPNLFDDYLNPASMIGSMADNLGQAPLRAQQEDSYIPYLTAVGTPLTVGAMAGIGTQNTGQFVNNLANPLAGTGDLVNNLGNKYLPNAYKLNPNAFKANPEMGYRMLGKEGYQDAIESGVLRAKPIPTQPTSGGISLARNTNRNPNTGKMQGALDRPYFADGFIDERYAADYMAAVNKADNNLVPIPTHKGIAPPEAGIIPLENATLYKKDWLRGYKQIETPKTDNFLPDIPMELNLDINNPAIDLVRNSPKIKGHRPDYGATDIGNDLTLYNNPSRVSDESSILGKKMAIKSVRDNTSKKSIELKTFIDDSGELKYYMSADMPNRVKAGRAFLELDKHIPVGAKIQEPGSLSTDSLLNVAKQSKNPKFESSISGTVQLNDNAVFNKIKNSGDSDLGREYYTTAEKAKEGVTEVNSLLEKYNLPSAEVRQVLKQDGTPSKVFSIHVPNVVLKKLYSVLGLPIAAATQLGNNEEQHTPQFQQGGEYTEAELAFLSEIAIKDNEGYRNPANKNKIVEISSPSISMKGIKQPIMAISKQTGEKKKLKPEQEYIFNNTTEVIEIPLFKAQQGVKIKDERLQNKNKK